MKAATIAARPHNGRLHIHQPDGSVQHVGRSGPVIDWHLHTPTALRRILKHPGTELGTSYIRGEWDIDTRQLPQLIEALVPRTSRRHMPLAPAGLGRLRARLSPERDQNRVPHWQDHSAWLSRICLGEEMHQGCALYAEPGTTLEQAQRRSCHRLLARLQLQAGQQVLDLDAGWGALALLLAEEARVRVTAFVRTQHQFVHIRNEARRRGLDGLVRVRCGSFYQCRGHFDRILAGGFLARQRPRDYPVLLRRMTALLQDDGFAWLRFTGRSRKIALSNRWYQDQLPSRHSLPLVSRLNHAVETSGLRTLLLEERSGHWLRTLREQAKRFQRRRDAISKRFGERCTRHWEFMLASEATALQWGQLGYYEMLLGNPRCLWLPDEAGEQRLAEDMPPELVSAIRGLARDI